MEAVNHYKARLAKVELENDDLRRQMSLNILKPGAIGPRSLLPPHEFSGFQVEDASSRIG